jgi:hypothetical protein
MKKTFKKSYFVFEFTDSIDHCSLTKHRILLSFILSYSSLQDPRFDLQKLDPLSFREKLNSYICCCPQDSVVEPILFDLIVNGIFTYLTVDYALQSILIT